MFKTTISDILRRRAELTPHERVFLFLEKGENESAAYTFAELDRKARTIGKRLDALGARGKRVLLPHPPGLEFVASFYGCLYAGAVAVPCCSSLLSTRQRARLDFILKDAEVEFILTASAESLNAFSESCLHLLAATEVLETENAHWSPHDCKPDDVAYIQYTSGSTSDPKGVVISHGNVISNQQMIQSAFEVKEGNVVVSWLPHFHDMGLVGIVQQAVYAGMSVVMMAPIDFIRRPAQWLRAISKYRASISGAPNFAYDLCVERIKDKEMAELDLSCWKLAFNGSEPVKAGTMERFAEKFGPAGFRMESFYPCYGLAEATLFVSTRVRSQSLRLHRPAVSCGQTWESERVVIVDPKTRRRRADGTEGEIWIAGPHVAQGYSKRGEETRKVFKAYLSDTGEGPFLRTGDLGYVTDGELYITGRLKEMIILHGKNHYPHDIEATVAMSHPLLRRDCGAAFSVEVTGREELVILQEVKRQTPPEKIVEIKGAIRQALAEDRAIKPYSVVLLKPNAIPKTSSGKIKRSACRAEFLRNSFAGSTLAILLFAILLLPQTARPQTTPESLTMTGDEIAKLIDDCGRRTSQMTGQLYNYTFHATDTDYVLDKQNRVKSEQSKVFEVYPINIGNRRKWIYLQISENGVPLSAEKIASERNRAVKQTMELEQQANAASPNQSTTVYKPRYSSYGIKVEKRSKFSRTIWFINPTDFLVSHDFYAPLRVSVGGRETFLLHFRPRPGYVYDKTNVPYPEGVEEFGRTMSQLGGRIWIDAIDKVIVRLEAMPARELKDSNTDVDENAAVLFELTRLPKGIWVPSVSRYNSYGKEEVFWKTPISRLRKYSDYKLFKTTVDVEKLETGPKQP